MIKFNDDLFVLLRSFCSGGKQDKDVMRLALRNYDKVIEDTYGVWLSQKARKLPGVTVNKFLKGVAKPTGIGLQLEHIIPVADRLDALIYLYGVKRIRDKKTLSKFIIDTFYAVYKQKDEPSAYEAECLLDEEIRESHRVEYFNEVYPTKR